MIKRTSKPTAIALSTLLIASLLPQKVQAQAAAPAAVQTCLTNAYCTVVVVVIGGLSYWAVTQDGQTQHFPVEEGEYLEEPEGTTEDWEERIWAGNPNEAVRRCREFAIANQVIYRGVEQMSGRAWRCKVRTYRS
ncbi:hypothetical protein H6G00_01240 [Leptolyngbya sp. FACHB-541]|uniref:hypothetical protein n=1 Tax=Leptolyngbya sp. FACHB-541 TaxID=2692810 RepID=UPI001688142B|nr:hypothetical protein [Leptolyngbya sp. FACHB-541]MBD1995254.1 hypothetical protein [Leptolyngbya sp. FACHB-541]